MRKIIPLLLMVVVACTTDSINYKNPYLPNYGFATSINTNLPAYSNLNFPGNYITLYGNGVGISGVVVFNTGSGFTAFELTCPNHAISNCSVLQVSGIEATCACDNFAYSLYTGLAKNQKYSLKPYRIEANNNILKIYN